jgi:hypothetical protein
MGDGMISSKVVYPTISLRREYPYLGIDDKGIVVLFVGICAGVYVGGLASTDELKVGTYSEKIRETSFRPWSGTIELRNDKND